MKSRKASLELSINAIVILILAITMLGLGLGFMRNIFGSATQQFTQVTGEVEKQMIEQLKSSGKIVDLDRPKITVKRGDTEQIYIGFKNVASDPVSFQIAGAVSPNNAIQGTAIAGLADPNTASCTQPVPASNVLTFPTDTLVQVSYKTSETSVQDGDVVVLPMNIKVQPSTSSGTCFFNIPVIISGTTNPVFTQLTVDVTV